MSFITERDGFQQMKVDIESPAEKIGLEQELASSWKTLNQIAGTSGTATNAQLSAAVRAIARFLIAFAKYANRRWNLKADLGP